jgi:hypothetical protein
VPTLRRARASSARWVTCAVVETAGDSAGVVDAPELGLKLRGFAGVRGGRRLSVIVMLLRGDCRGSAVPGKRIGALDAL